MYINNYNNQQKRFTYYSKKNHSTDYTMQKSFAKFNYEFNDTKAEF